MSRIPCCDVRSVLLFEIMFTYSIILYDLNSETIACIVRRRCFHRGPTLLHMFLVPVSQTSGLYLIKTGFVMLTNVCSFYIKQPQRLCRFCSLFHMKALRTCHALQVFPMLFQCWQECLSSMQSSIA